MAADAGALPQPLVDELLCIADTKWVLGHWYIKLIQNGRSLTDFNAFAAMAQDQLGHTRALFSLLEQRHGLPPNRLEFERTREEVHSMAALDAPPANWSDFVVTAAMAELALQALVGGYVGGSDAALAGIAAKFNEECEFHTLYFDGSLQGLTAAELEPARQALAQRFPLALRWFDAGDTAAADAVHAQGWRRSPLTELRARFVAACERRIAARLETPLPSATQARRGEPWDGARRRPPGSAMPAALWEFVLPTNEQAVMCRRPLRVSSDDSIRFTIGA